MIFPIHLPNKKDYDLFKNIMNEIRALTNTPNWRTILTVMTEHLVKLRERELLIEKKKQLKEYGEILIHFIMQNEIKET